MYYRIYELIGPYGNSTFCFRAEYVRCSKLPVATRCPNPSEASQISAKYPIQEPIRRHQNLVPDA